MEPLIALIATTGAARLAGRLRVPQLDDWGASLRCGVAGMFTLTGVSHFVGMREAMVEMVPPALPEPELLVVVSGVLELAGAAGVFLEPTAKAAAGGLTLMLVALFPANVHHALSADTVRWDDRLLPRTVLQLAFLAATTAVFLERRGDRLSSRPARRAVPGVA